MGDAVSKEGSMTLATRLISTLVLGSSVVAFAAPAIAQQDSARDAAIHRCIIQAQREYPDATSDSAQRSRTMSYKACMTAAGQVP
jgi:hypothetical protein